MFKGLLFVLIKGQFLLHDRIPFDDLHRRETHRDPGSFRVVFNEVDNCMDTAVDSTAVIIAAAEVLTQRSFLITGDMDRVLDEFIDAFVLDRRNGDDRDTQ